MKVVIDIPKEMYTTLELGRFGAKYSMYDLAGSVMHGTPLPKGHGRLIDADDINNHIVGHIDTRDCPTIIEADKAESEDKR